MNTRDSIRLQSQKDPVQLEREIDQQRSRIEHLVEVLESKLSPGEMFNRALHYGKDGGREFAGNLADTVKANPVPTLLTSAGLLWLYAGKDKHNGSAYRTAQPSMDERTGHLREGVSEKLGSAKHRAGAAAHGAAESVRQRAQRANSGFHHMLDDNPMALGAMGIAVGALLGSMLPPTRKEGELMGEASEKMSEKMTGWTRPAAAHADEDRMAREAGGTASDTSDFTGAGTDRMDTSRTGAGGRSERGDGGQHYRQPPGSDGPGATPSPGRPS